MGNRTALDIVAAREHTITTRRTRAHVIVCHDLNFRARPLLDLFSLGNRVSQEVRDAAARELAEDIISDADVLIKELEEIKAFAERQLTKLEAAE
ncbi:MAG TPA: hypothetical protein VHY35_06225 [Stellaceae bacterium]|jgi:hypothetical protein|nr:hypothetical protein [Stellaceae bacterium]